MLALKNEELRRPLRILACSLLVLTLAILVLTYVVKNSKRFEAAKGGKLEGFARCVVEDLVGGLVWTCRQAAQGLRYANRRRGSSFRVITTMRKVGETGSANVASCGSQEAGASGVMA